MASKYKGYMGNMLWVDLSTGETKEFDVTDRDREMFLGGKALATKILMDNQPAGIDPLSPDALLVINAGPLVGSGAPCSSRFNISCKSPATGGIGTSNCGGNFGINMKKCGYDAIVVKGKAEKPVYIDVTDSGVEIKDASHLWGMDTEKTQEALDERAGKIVIGPAGENLVLYACIISQERAAGRCGVGTVMGSKNLKAIQAKGKKKVEVADRDGFKKGVKIWINTLKNHPTTGDTLPKYGSANLMNTVNIGNALPTTNFKTGTFKDAYPISGEGMAETELVKNKGCVSCPIKCGRIVNVDGKDVKGPEFETLGLFGSNLENSDLKAICRWNRQMDLLGIDTISAGNVIGYVMELKKRGMIESDLEFGKTDNIDKILEDIAFRRGLGDDMAQGVKRMSEKYGGKEFAIHSKGLEISSYDPRSSFGLGLGYATANRGGCHLNAGYMIFMEMIGPVTMQPRTARGKIGTTVFQQNSMDAVSSIGNCLFTTFAVVPAAAHKINKTGLLGRIISKVLEYSGPLMDRLGAMLPWGMAINAPGIMPQPFVIGKLTGMKMNMGLFIQAGERAFNIDRLFNIREGLGKNDDTLPGRFTDELIDKDRANSKVPLSVMLPKYYKVRGWDAAGVPSFKKLKKLGLDKYAV